MALNYPTVTQAQGPSGAVFGHDSDMRCDVWWAHPARGDTGPVRPARRGGARSLRGLSQGGRQAAVPHRPGTDPRRGGRRARHRARRGGAGQLLFRLRQATRQASRRRLDPGGVDLPLGRLGGARDDRRGAGRRRRGGGPRRGGRQPGGDLLLPRRADDVRVGAGSGPAPRVLHLLGPQGGRGQGDRQGHVGVDEQADPDRPRRAATRGRLRVGRRGHRRWHGWSTWTVAPRTGQAWRCSRTRPRKWRNTRRRTCSPHWPDGPMPDGPLACTGNVRTRLSATSPRGHRGYFRRRMASSR